MAGQIERPDLLRTKFYRPRATGNLVRRPRVREILTSNLDRALTLVCAPAGFGKTMLLSDWLDSCPVPSTWLSLDERDSDLGIFLSYLVAAVRTLFPDACHDTAAQLQSPALPPLHSLVTALANDLDRLPDEVGLPPGQRFVVVLDDYHLVQGHAVHALLGELLRHPPRTMHLILSTRQDPPFPLHALRARGELAEVRGRELRFTFEEIEAFMAQAVGTPLDATALAVLAERTEGWATGLRLAALTLNAGGDVTHAELSVDNRFVLDYLLNEVFAHVPVATHNFLVKTSILDRLCGPLCDAVAGAPGPGWNGNAYLEWLTAANLFTFSVDARGDWYRYHHLFQKLLRNQLERLSSGQEIADLHSRACAWLAENGLIDEAIEHALAAGDTATTVRLVEEHRHEATNHENWRQLERWLSLLPRRLIDAWPELMILEAWTFHGRFRLSDLAACLHRIENALEQTPRPVETERRIRGELDALRSQILYWSAGPLQTLEAAQNALSLLPDKCSYARAAAVAYLAAALQLQGKSSESVGLVTSALNDEKLCGGVARARLLFILCVIYLMKADTVSVIRTGDRLLEVASQEGLPDSETRAYFYLGCAYYLTNNLVSAEKCFRNVVEQRYAAYGLIAVQSGFGLATVYQAQGFPERAAAVSNVTLDYARTVNNDNLLRDAEAFEAHLALLQGRHARAGAWGDRGDDGIPATPMPLFFVPAFTYVEFLLAQGTPESRQKAARDLARLRDIVEVNHNTRFLIEVLTLQSLLRADLGERSAALALLEQAIHLAEPGNITRVFVDRGPKIAVLLRQLASRRAAPSFLHRLLAAFGDASKIEPVTKHDRLSRPSAAGPESAAELLIEPLSERELEVLALLNERLSNKEIATELSISPTTVKRHTVNIYQKLAVGGRRDAVARASELRLLPGDSARTLWSYLSSRARDT